VYHPIGEDQLWTETSFYGANHVPSLTVQSGAHGSVAGQGDTRLYPKPKETQDAGQIPLSGHCCAIPCRAVEKRRYERRNRIEIMFRRLKDWRRVATRYDRYPKVFLLAIALTALVI